MQPFETPTIELTGERFILLAHEIFGYHVGYEEMFVVNLPRAAMGLGRPKEENITFGCVSEDVPDNIYVSHTPPKTKEGKGTTICSPALTIHVMTSE